VEFSLINPLQSGRWDEVIAAFPQATVFHSSPWCRVLHQSYRYRPLYLLGTENGTPGCALPLMEVRSVLTGRRGVSLPFTDFCPPLLSPGVETGELVDFLASLARRSGWSSFEVRGCREMPSSAPVSEALLHHSLPLVKDPRAMARGYREATRRNIATAVRQGVTVREDPSPAGMEAFRLLNRLTRRDHCLPPQPPRFFKLLHRHVIAPGFGKVFLAEREGETVAGAVFLHWGGRAVYKYGASDRRFFPLRPNNLIMDEAIRRYGEQGMSDLSFGRTEPGHQGLRRFKLGWGAVEEPASYFKFDTGKMAFAAGSPGVSEKAKKVFSRLPLPALDLLGRVLYRHMG
jgi:hypothetical protein